MDPATASAGVFSVAKLWAIIAGVCGSIVPILALSDTQKITRRNSFFMALTGSSFSIFVGPAIAEKLSLNSLEYIGALSWIMGATGVYVVRTLLKWLEKRGVKVLDRAVNKVLGPDTTTDKDDE